MSYAVGQRLPVWTRQTDLMHWNRFAAVNDEFHGLHMDDDAGRAAGNATGAFGMGNLRYAYLANALHDWFGDDNQILEMTCRYRAINQKNDQLRVHGEILAIADHGDTLILDIGMDVLNGDGESTCPGSARVSILQAAMNGQ